jgi:hypothetical protein
MKRFTTLAALWTALVLCAVGRPSAIAQEETATRKPLIQIAILLDTSGSMSGLIEQAKAQLWSIVNEMASARHGEAYADFEVALYEYGKSSLPQEQGYIRMILPLTTDLDKVSEELFALRTNGGQEYCGQVIRDAVADLAWSASEADYKAIVIAGNERFTQGTVDYRTSCKSAVTRGIVVNTIHCGDRDEGAKGMWADGAALADGAYMNIDQNRQVVQIEAPQDAEIARLGVLLNDTYVPYGSMGAAGAARQAAQDSNAAQMAAVVGAQRGAAKASAHYRNSNWDLVDALREETVHLDDVKEEDLPEQLRAMSPEERQAYVDGKAAERAELQEKIRKLNGDRRAYVDAEMKKRADEGANTLGRVIVKAVRGQAEAAGFTFDD